MKIVVDAGHGINTPGKRTPDDEREWSFNNKVAKAFIAELKKYEGVKILRVDDATGKTDISLEDRTDKANAFDADVYVSFHHNANTGKWGTWTGTETFVHPNASAKSKKLASLVHAEIVKAYKLKDRGIKTDNFHVLRETGMPAILLEGGYMDSKIDIVKLRDDKVLKNAGIGAAKAVATFGGLKKKVTVVTHTVANGDTLWSISRKYAVSVEQIKSKNGLKSSVIQPGDKLVIK
jgi:N-acetylmuramoyl-L-alanine amidase